VIGSTRQVAVWAYGSPADLRKGFDGLSGLVAEGLGQDPLSDDCYLFVNAKRRGREHDAADERTAFEKQLQFAHRQPHHARRGVPPQAREAPALESLRVDAEPGAVPEEDLRQARGAHRELSHLRGEDASAAQRQLEALKEILAHREQALFDASSEKRPPPTTAPAAPATAPLQRGHGPKAQPALPIIDMVHELAVSERTCTACGGVLDEMTGQTEASEEITVVERRFVMLRQIRQKYRCACNGCIETAPGPLRLTARPYRRGRRYSADFAIEVAIGKYLDHLPLERQVRTMRREGLAIDSQTLWDQLDAAATILAPTYEALRQHVQAAPVIGADETWWRVFVGPGNKRWWAWSLTSETAVTYTILESRSQEAARQVLNGYQGIVVADGYGAYEALARAGPRFTLAHCWAHVRRKFVEAEPHHPGRKNHYGSRSRRGTEVAALFYSLIESAKLCGVEPKAYLLRAFRAALASPGAVTLPHTLAP
jgi:transposase